jgi:hypothetical protein
MEPAYREIVFEPHVLNALVLLLFAVFVGHIGVCWDPKKWQ